MSKISLFLAIAQRAGRLPNFRGKVRGLQILYRLFGLNGEHVRTEARLHRPVPYPINLDLHSAHERMALFMGGYEQDTTTFLVRLFDPRGFFLDVGANVGLISLPFVHLVGESALHAKDQAETPVAYCLEPVRSNYDSLLANIHLNELDSRIRALCVAAGAVEQDAEIQIEGDLDEGEGTGTANILPTTSDHPCKRVPVQVRTIDRLVEGGQLPKRVSLIKLDTDGYDLNALLGAKRLLETARPIVFGEFSAQCLAWHGQDVGAVRVLAEEVAYELFVRELPSWKFHSFSEARRFVQDLLLVPEESTGEIEWCLS